MMGPRGPFGDYLVMTIVVSCLIGIMVGDALSPVPEAGATGGLVGLYLAIVVATLAHARYQYRRGSDADEEVAS